MAYPQAAKAVVKYVAHASKTYGSYVIYAYDDYSTLKVYSDGTQVTGTWAPNVSTWWAP